MTTVPCRACRTALEPTATLCPICLRPRGAVEITRDLAALRELQRLRRRRPFAILGYALLLGAAARIVGLYRLPLAASATSLYARAARFYQESLDPRNLVSTPAEKRSPAPPSPATAATPEAPPSAPAPTAAAAVLAAPAPAAPRTEASPARVEDLPLPPLDPGTQWAIYGRVYDLITLSPVAGVQLTFQAEGKVDLHTQTDAAGRFSAALWRSDSAYEIHAFHPDYAPVALYEADIPYAKLKIEERNNIARGARDGDVTIPPLNDVSGEDSMRRDLFMAPRR